MRKISDTNHEETLNKDIEDSVFDAIMDGKRQSMTGFLFDENGVFVPVMKPAGSNELVLSSKDKDQLSRSPAFFRKKKQNVSTFKTFIVEDDKKGSEGKRSLAYRHVNTHVHSCTYTHIRTRVHTRTRTHPLYTCIHM